MFEFPVGKCQKFNFSGTGLTELYECLKEHILLTTIEILL